MATISILYMYIALLILDVTFMQLDNYDDWPGATTQGSYSCTIATSKISKFCSKLEKITLAK